MRTPQQAMKDAIESGAVQAWIDGKCIRSKTEGKDSWQEFEGFSKHPAFTEVRLHWRPAPDPKLRPWKPEEVPVGALYRWHGDISVILAATRDGIKFVSSCGEIEGNFYDSGLMSEHSSHSTDGGKTWRPCGVMEGAE